MSGTHRAVRDVIAAQRTVEGAGFVVRRPFPTQGLDQLDPFLLLDEMGPTTYAPGEAVGAPDHPHRGFETVTYLLEGALAHRDSTGAVGVIRPGAVQWMTAGAGVVHSEMPTDDIRLRGGTVHGVQLWVNLPAAEKRRPPRYQGFEADELGAGTTGRGGAVRVIAGEVAGAVGPVDTTVPVTYAHATLLTDDELIWAVPADQTALAYVLDGSVTVVGDGGDDTRVAAGQLAVFERAGQLVELRSTDGADLLVLAGRPIGEPIARYGPFVMNSRAEIMEAFDDLAAGRLGTIPGSGSGITRA